ncbi:flavin monoamine oxidase family protein [Fastidiosibacter lacustris]|uniref:flavin monoamine oxidase family protein n=1 Tax=Fastidiosibacter lacustris TaxID=2056695 RepID=UPI000E34E573|nr:NAD(P)/FAD-dependent oxidoreductase [Fastidiosibacter lacustris]
MQIYDVIVVGAGVSGLAAANNLMLNGFDVLVVEARDRVGGRINSQAFAGVIVDLGASWIHGVQENPITRLAKKHNISTWRSQMCGPSPDNILHREMFNTEFKRLTHEQKLKIANWMADFLDYLETVQIDEESHLKSIADLKRQFILEQNIIKEDESYIDYIADTLFLYEYAIEAKDLSAESHHADIDFAGSDRLFPQGYAQITDLLAKNLVIQLNEPVQSIDYSGDLVQVITAASQYHATYVLVTVPLGVLKHADIGFNPYLPQSKRKSISQLEMGILNKIYLEFEDVFWDKEAQSIACLSPEHRIAREMMNFYPLSQKPILMAFTAGVVAKQLEHLSDRELIALVIDSLKHMYGENLPNLKNYCITRWHSDEYSYGSYSYLPVGVKAKRRQKLGKPVDNKVFFAGEATSFYFPSTVHGAFLSGVRSAYQILQIDLLTEDVRKKTAIVEDPYL